MSFPGMEAGVAMLVPDWNLRRTIGRVSLMPSTERKILKRRGRVVLVETRNTTLGSGYSIRIGSLGLWSGDNLAEAERQFEQATE